MVIVFGGTCELWPYDSFYALVSHCISSSETESDLICVRMPEFLWHVLCSMLFLKGTVIFWNLLWNRVMVQCFMCRICTWIMIWISICFFLVTSYGALILHVIYLTLQIGRFALGHFSISQHVENIYFVTYTYIHTYIRKKSIIVRLVPQIHVAFFGQS